MHHDPGMLLTTNLSIINHTNEYNLELTYEVNVDYTTRSVSKEFNKIINGDEIKSLSSGERTNLSFK